MYVQARVQFMHVHDHQVSVSKRHRSLPLKISNLITPFLHLNQRIPRQTYTRLYRDDIAVTRYSYDDT